MKFKHACSRTEPPGGGASLAELISPGNEVRCIDAFIDSLPLEKLGFRTDFPENGRPAYHPTVLLKLLLYGYLNRIRIRSSELPGERVSLHRVSDVAAGP